MTNDMMNLRALMEKSPDADFLREMSGYGAQRLMGFCLRIYPPSTKAPEGRRVYGVKYRVGRTQRWFRIGEHGSPWTPDTVEA
ncbi:MAG: Integrase [Caulobacteraceae bacterium]|jgi:hypothetical protein|nr:Integrase [Caulobacteraceae bacterium]